MNVFISHAAEQRADADRLAIALRTQGDTVFLDADDLRPGGDYQARIESAIRSCDLFCFLIAPESVAPGRFPLSELAMARKRWPNPVGRVVPIMVSRVPMDSVPAYLRAVSVLVPEGDFVADSLSAIADLRPAHSWKRASIAVIGAVVVVLAAGLSLYTRRAPAAEPARETRQADTTGDESDQAALRARAADSMQTIKGFAAYLRQAGFEHVSDAVTVYFYSRQVPLPPGLAQDSDVVNAFYQDRTLYVHRSLSGDASVLLREFTHSVLADSVGSDQVGASDVESGLADYLPASYLGTSLIGEGLGGVFNLPTTYIRRLDRFTSYADAADESHAKGEVWSGAFWSCRQEVGQAATDAAVVWAWKGSISMPVTPAVTARFGSMLQHAKAPAGPCLAREVTRRHLPH